jgi:pimeloyl-ACP methyl ester carboxylesterase
MHRGYRNFVHRRRAELHAGSTLVTTRAGVVEYGEAGPPTGRAVLLFPGGGGGYEQVHLLNPLPDLGCRVIGWSRPGYLRTPLDVGRTFAEQADAAKALLDELGVATAVAYGISGGGPIAIEFTRRHPERADALILESAVTRHYDPAISPLVRMIYLSPLGTWLTTQLVQRLPRAALRDFVRQESTLSRQARQATVRWILTDHKRLAYARAVMAALTPFEDRAAGLDNDLRQWATLDDSATAGITCPTLILHGTHDGDADPAHAHHAATTISQATLHLVPDGWHLLPLSINGTSAQQARSAFLDIAQPPTPQRRTA